MKLIDVLHFVNFSSGDLQDMTFRYLNFNNHFSSQCFKDSKSLCKQSASLIDDICLHSIISSAKSLILIYYGEYYQQHH